MDGTTRGAVEDARQTGGGQCNKKEEEECETSRWWAMRGDPATNDMTRGGGWRTLCKVMGQWMTL